MKETKAQHGENVLTSSVAEPDFLSGLYSKIYIMWRILHKLGMLRNKYVNNELWEVV